MNLIYFSSHPLHKSNSMTGYGTHQRSSIKAFRDLNCNITPIIIADIKSSDSPTNNNPSPNKGDLKSKLPRFIINFFKDLKLLNHSRNSGKILKNKIKTIQPDFIYERSEHLMFSGARIAKKTGTPIILEVNAPFVEEIRKWEGWSPWHWLANRIEKYKLKHAKHVIVVSSALKDYIIKKFNVDAHKISIAPNCIEPSSGKIDDHKINEIKQQYNLNNKKTIGFVGSIFPYHGVELLIRSFNQAYTINSDIALLIVGDGQIMPQLQHIAQSLPASNNIIFTGNIPHVEVINYIAAMDLCTMPNSNWYGSPIKIFEYGILAKTIIAPNYAPLRDVMKNKVDGILIEPNQNNLANAIQFCLDNPKEATLMGKNFKNKILSEYTWKKSMSRILELFTP